MAHFRKRGSTWTAIIERAGYRNEYSTFQRKVEAQAWAAKRESELLAGVRGQVIPGSVRLALERYSREIATMHRGCRWEQIRLKKFAGSVNEGGLRFLDRLCGEVVPSDLAEWRDARLRAVKGASVRREMVLLQSVFEVARKEWNLLRTNPLADVKKPSSSRARSRRVSPTEVEALLVRLGHAEYPQASHAETVSQRVGLALLFAIHTGLRAGELCSLTSDQIFPEQQYLHLSKTKNGDERDVPLSKDALAILAYLPKSAKLFDLKTSQVDSLFRKAKKAAGIVDLHFHDSRHEAVTRMARKLDILDLARTIGHRDLKSLQVYYNPTASEIAARLDS